MKTISTVLLLLLFTVSVRGQNTDALTGDWAGYINVQGQQLIIKTHFTGDDSLRGTIDIPQQGGQGIPLQNIKLTGADSVFFEFMAGPGLAEFKGAFDSDSLITGSFHQNGMQFPFKLKRYEPKNDPSKTKAKVPLSYNHKELIIKNDSIKIGGTLTWPEDEQPFPLIIMITGSGAQDRDETLKPVSDFKPFALLADSLTMNGIATFRYDDRGVGQSTGNFSKTTLDMLASDVEAIIADLSNRQDHNFNQINLLGHSQGGIVGGKVAAENKVVDGLILMASTGVPLKEILRYQVKQAFFNAPIDSQLIEQEVAAREQLMESIKEGKGVKEAQEKYQKRFAAIQMAAGADSARALSIAQNQAQQLRSALSTPQMQSLLFYDPTKDLHQLDIPVLALFGGKDTQVTIAINKKPIKKVLEAAGVPYQIKIFENANHPFQKAKTGRVQEYGSLPRQFVDGFTQTIAQWTKKLNQ